jgi:hypothetical protein
MEVSLGELFARDMSALSAEIIADLQAAVTYGMRHVADGARDDLKAQIRAAGLGNGLANAMRSRTYPRQPSFNATAYVYSRAPEIIAAFSLGVTITAHRGKYLALPTLFNLRGGRRGGGLIRVGSEARVRKNLRITAQAMAALKTGTFTRPFRNGRGLIWFLKVRGVRTGERRKLRAFARSVPSLEFGSGRGKRVRDIVSEGAVPMFLLVPKVTIQRAIDVDTVAKVWAARTPDEILAEFGRRRAAQ